MARTWSKDDPKAALMTRKRTIIVQAALRAFLNTGYAESSVNRIAADAGVSIKTLYRHFHSKDDLFSAVMQLACSGATEHASGPVQAASVSERPWFSQPPSVALPIAGQEYLQNALSEGQIALYRVVTRDTHRFPELGLRYRNEVTGQRDAIFDEYLNRWRPVMRWKVANHRHAASVFASLLKADLFDDAIHGCRTPDQAEILARSHESATIMLTLLEVGCL
jgi:AcrR family transcriptional regulator